MRLQKDYVNIMVCINRLFRILFSFTSALELFSLFHCWPRNSIKRGTSKTDFPLPIGWTDICSLSANLDTKACSLWASFKNAGNLKIAVKKNLTKVQNSKIAINRNLTKVQNSKITINRNFTKSEKLKRYFIKDFNFNFFSGRCERRFVTFAKFSVHYLQYDSTTGLDYLLLEGSSKCDRKMR